MPFDKPAADLPLDEGVVGRMVAEQCPQWASEPIEFIVAGWDNAMFRLGADLMVRVPRRAVAVPLIEAEQRWLPRLAPALPLPIPVPVHVGVPGEAYPWPWSVVAYVAGRSALDAAVEDGWASHGVTGSVRIARALGRFCAAMATIPVPADPPLNPYRGMPLAQRQDRFDECIDACRDVLDQATIAAAVEVWERCVAAPRSETATWLHGDLHPANVIVDDLASADPTVSVVDFGDMCIGDPAGDLLVGWQLFDVTARRAFRDASGVDDATWMRGRGWALAHGLMCLANSADDPSFTALGRHSVEAVISDPA